MNPAIVKKLERLAEDGQIRVDGEPDFDRWSARVSTFLSTAIGAEEENRFLKLETGDWPETLALRVGYLEGLTASAETPTPTQAKGQASPTAPPVIEYFSDSRKVFIVHGHDDPSKESTARFLERLGLQAIILHEQPSAGRTIIEKFETYSEDIAFAVVLLTPDDRGGEAAEKSSLNPRARQNVIMELGYFIGRLGRTRVCAIHKGGVELPSDYQGVLYIEMDASGAWKTKLAQELVQAKVPIELAGLLKG